MNAETPSGPRARPVTCDLTAEADPSLLPRVLQSFARRDITPDDIRARCAQGRMNLRVFCAALEGDCLRTIEGNLRQLIGLHRLEVALHARLRQEEVLF